MSEREILFRGKRVGNGEWETGSLVRIRMGCSDEQTCIADKMTGYLTPIIPESIGQYTGLTDKNGLTKIFEGDIISCDYFIGTVSFCNGCWCASEVGKIPEDLYELVNLEVLGNIHDNGYPF